MIALTFEAFYEQDYESVRRALTVALGDSRLAEEAAQEAFAEAFAHWKRVRLWAVTESRVRRSSKVAVEDQGSARCEPIGDSLAAVRVRWRRWRGLGVRVAASWGL